MNVLMKLLVRFFCRILALFPRQWVRSLGRPLGILWFDILRACADRSCLKIFGLPFPQWSEAARIKVGRKSVYSMNENLIEFFVIPSMNEHWLKKNVVFEGEENLVQALKQNRGAYALSLHLGNGDLATSILALSGFKIHLITKIFKNKFVNDLWFFVRKFHGVQFIEAHGSKTPFEILKAIKNNEVVIFVNDQFMGNPMGSRPSFSEKKRERLLDCLFFT
jgi:lauroyl/myristoyl acyltransferase